MNESSFFFFSFSFFTMTKSGTHAVTIETQAISKDYRAVKDLTVKKQQTKELITSQQTSHKHNNKDLSRLRQIPPDMRVNAMYQSPTKSTRSQCVCNGKVRMYWSKIRFDSSKFMYTTRDTAKPLTL